MFSVIICTYNPDPRIFDRLLSAIEIFPNAPAFEVIIVDNNSTLALSEVPRVQQFLQKIPSARILRESKPGLTNARIAGILEAKYEWIVFFDDDNEPDPNYLSAAATIIEQYPKVGAWGPGIVKVEYPNAHFETRFASFKPIFQQRTEATARMAGEVWWQDCYPAGTGLIIQKNIALAYKEQVIAGQYRLSDRNGKSLSSGGDVQMVLTGIKLGWQAGVHPALKMKHLIGEDKLSFAYLKKLAYGTAASNVPAHVQVWGWDTRQFLPPIFKDIIQQIYYHLKVLAPKEGLIQTQIKLAAYLGAVSALYGLHPEYKPSFWWKIACTILKIQ